MGVIWEPVRDAESQTLPPDLHQTPYIRVCILTRSSVIGTTEEFVCGKTSAPKVKRNPAARKKEVIAFPPCFVVSVTHAALLIPLELSVELGDTPSPRQASRRDYSPVSPSPVTWWGLLAYCRGYKIARQNSLLFTSLGPFCWTHTKSIVSDLHFSCAKALKPKTCRVVPSTALNPKSWVQTQTLRTLQSVPDQILLWQHTNFRNSI